MTRGFTGQQVEMLLRPIKTRRVMHAQGQAHIPAYDVVAHLNRLFGFDGWDKTIKSIELVEERSVESNKDGKARTGWYVTYRCLMQLVVRDPAGNVVLTREDGACGSASNLPSLGDAHDFAYKNAISYALKRCAKDLGDQFGLSLYNKGATGALVGTTLVGRGPSGAPLEDVQDHAPVPESLGNDERQIDLETGEIFGGGAGGSVPAEPPAPTATRPPSGRAGATAPTQKSGGDSESKTASSKADQGGSGVTVTPDATGTKLSQTTSRRLFAMLKGAGIGEGDRHAWASAQLRRQVGSFSELSEADGRALCDAVKAASEASA